ncbi:hypothetical protein ACFLUU_07790 [Chloroflexota bacterium]
MSRHLFLSLALVCFVGLIAVFVVDGYIGIYDTLYITTGEQSWKVEADVWQRQYPTYAPARIEYAPMPLEGDKGGYYMGANRDEKISFRYEVDNRKISTYDADIEVAVWKGQKKIRDLISQPVSIAAFEKGELEWVIDNTELLPEDILPEQGYQYTVIIKGGEIERRIVVSINPLVYR